jgi:hypothetical protein
MALGWPLGKLIWTSDPGLISLVILSALARRGDKVTPRPIAMLAERQVSPAIEELMVEVGEISFELLLGVC